MFLYRIISNAWKVILPISVWRFTASSHRQFSVADTSLNGLPSMNISPSMTVPASSGISMSLKWGRLSVFSQNHCVFLLTRREKQRVNPRLSEGTQSRFNLLLSKNCKIPRVPSNFSSTYTSSLLNLRSCSCSEISCASMGSHHIHLLFSKSAGLVKLVNHATGLGLFTFLNFRRFLICAFLTLFDCFRYCVHTNGE